MEIDEQPDAEVLLELNSAPSIEELDALEAEETEAADDIPLAGTDQALYQLRMDYAAETFFAPTPPKGGEYQRGDFVIIPTKFGRDIACVKGIARHPWGCCRSNMVFIERKATSEELSFQKELAAREKEAEKVFLEKSAEHGLDMKLVGVHFLFDDSKVIFFFSSDNRVDFRDLVVDLSCVFRMRIELRQISARDEGRICGALGICGRSVCCRSVSDHLKSVNIRMAKDQNLSLNSLKISGQCGRLLCCLGFENIWYADVRKTMPPEGAELSYDGAEFCITGVNLLTATVQIRELHAVDGRTLEIPGNRFAREGNRWIVTD